MTTILFLIVSCILALSVNAKRTHEAITFINYSDEPIEIFWGFDPSPVLTVGGNDADSLDTFSGHSFFYKWKNAEKNVKIRETSGVEEKRKGEPQADTEGILAQFHILGGMDQEEPDKFPGMPYIQGCAIIPDPDSTSLGYGEL